MRCMLRGGGRWWQLVLVVVPVGIGVLVGPWAFSQVHIAGSPWLARLATAFIGAVPGAVKLFSSRAAQLLGNLVQQQAAQRDKLRTLTSATVSQGSRMFRVADLRGRRDIWGIHPAISVANGKPGTRNSELPAYVERDIDAELRAALTDMATVGGFLLLVGRSATGKSRTAYEALQATLPDWKLLIPADAAEIDTWLSYRNKLDQTVIWLDDMAPLLASGKMTAHVLKRVLSDRDHPVMLIGTIWPDTYDELIHEDVVVPDLAVAQVWRDNRTILTKLVTRKYTLDDFSDTEWARAHEIAAQDNRIADVIRFWNVHSLPQLLASKDRLEARWLGRVNVYGSAIVSAVIAVRRCGYYEPVSLEILKSLAPCFLTGVQRAAARADNWFDTAVQWAIKPIQGGASPSLLVSYATTIGEPIGWLASDILVDYAETNSLPIPDEAWAVLLEKADLGACASVAYRARLRKRDDVARRILNRIVDADDLEESPIACVDLAFLELERGNLAEAEELYNCAIRFGHPMCTDVASTMAAAMCQMAGRLGEAEEIFESLLASADEMARSAALLGMAEIAALRGQLNSAEAGYRQVLEVGEPIAQFGALLGLHKIYELRGQAGETLETFERLYSSAKVYDIPMMWALIGGVLEIYGRSEEARSLLQRAADSGDWFAASLASLAIGDLEKKRHNWDGAEAAFRQASSSGMRQVDSLALVGLAQTRAQRQDLAGAELAYSRALGIEHPYSYPLALVGLASIYAIQGKIDLAEELFLKAISSNHPEAAPQASICLASLLVQLGRTGEAEPIYQQLTESDIPPLMLAGQLGIGEVCLARGDFVTAEAQFRHGYTADNELVRAVSGYHLGAALVMQGNVKAGLPYLEEATKSENKGVAALGRLGIGGVMADRGRLTEAASHFQAAADSKVPLVAPLGWFNLGKTHALLGDIERAEDAYARAIESGHPVAAMLAATWRSMSPEGAPRLAAPRPLGRVRIDKFLRQGDTEVSASEE